MLLAISVALTIFCWVGFVVVYFRTEIFRWADNRFGRSSIKRRPPKPPRRRLYD